MAVREGGPDLLIIPIQNSSKMKLVSKDLAVMHLFSCFLITSS